MEVQMKVKLAAGRVVALGKRGAPLLVCMVITAVRCSAAQSPIGKWLIDLSAEATSTWAWAGTGIGLTIGLLGLKFGSHDAKGKFASLAVTSFALLSVQGIMAYLQSEG